MSQMLVQHDHLSNPLVPFVFIDCCGTFQSYEARYCQDLAGALMAHGISASSIAILIFYKNQQHFLAWFSSSSSIALHTFACIRGCDYGIVILLLICADVTTDTEARLDDPLRLSVAEVQVRVRSPVVAVSTPELEPTYGLVSRLRSIVDLATLQDMFAETNNNDIDDDRLR